MANEKEIRTKIGSVKNTQKITKAMEMVAASKMRRTQETMKKALPYADKIRAVIGHIYNANPDYKHPFLEKRELKTAGYIVVSSDRGLFRRAGKWIIPMNSTILSQLGSG